MRARLLPLLFLFAAGCAGRGAILRSARPPSPSAECARERGFRYCLYRAPEGVAEDPSALLYFLHGGGGGAEDWGAWEVSRAYYEEFRRRGLPAPRVAAVSFGRVWLLTDPGKGPSSGLLPRFVDEAMRAVEARTGSPERRLLWGLSMGGYNVSQLLLKHPSLWSAAALSCPGISTLSPLAGPAEIDAYVRETGAERGKAEWMVKTARAYYATPEEWERNAPLILGPRASGLPPVFVECGDKDEYGFFSGARGFAEGLRAAGNSVRFEAIPGGVHCTVRHADVIAFLADSLSASSARAGR